MAPRFFERERERERISLLKFSNYCELKKGDFTLLYVLLSRLLLRKVK